MDISILIPILDSVSKAMEVTPFHWVALAGCVLAGVVVVLRKIQAAKVVAPVEVVKLPVAKLTDVPADVKVLATVTDIADKTLGK